MASCTVTPGDPASSGDQLYGPRSCWQAFIDWAWDAYDFDKGDWDDGFGWHDACNIQRPLARTFNAIWCLEYSSPDPSNESYDMPILWWGGRYARSHIDELDARCGDGSAFATTRRGGWFVDEWTRLFLDFFYTQGVPERAGTLVHEARHADAGKSHTNGQDPDWAYNGAFRFQIAWLAWFMNQCNNTSPAMKIRARQDANNRLATRFAADPGFRIDANGFAV